MYIFFRIQLMGAKAGYYIERLALYSNYTGSGKKTGHFIFDYNSGISWSILAIFSPVETGINMPQFRVIYLLNSLMTS